MTLLKFRTRRDRQHRPASMAAPTVADWGAGWNAAYDAAAGRHAAPSRWFSNPHGIATDETAARIVAEAGRLAAEAAVTAGTSTEPWDKPEDLYRDEGDDWAAMERPFVPFPVPAYRAPTVADDLADLPLFREAVRRHTRRHGAQCQCGQDIAGDTWGGRMVSAGTHLLGGAA